jgi:hypothetical protein
MEDKNPEERNDAILSPEDLELEETERIDENRHVVPVEDEGSEETISERKTARDRMSETQKAYIMTATVRTPDGEGSFETASNDVTEFFEDFLRWYLSRITYDEEPEEALRVLVESSSL